MLARFRTTPASWRVARAGAAMGCRNYHSYPEPNEVPVITTKKAEVGVKPTKNEEEFRAMKKFDVKKVYGVGEAATVSSVPSQPPTRITRLRNGLTVASQDMPGLMSSIQLLVKSGR
jgi:hypothetical protein